MLNFNLLDDNESDIEDLLQVEEFSTQDIAIIGLSAQLPLVANMDEFWQFICNGVDFISEFPQSRRRDVNIFANHRRGDNGSPDYYEGAYLDEIDQFDYSFFRLSPKEASLMSPNQRLFLQTAWKSIEDAGYSSKSIAGSRTGVFIGFNGDSLYDYKRMISDTDPELMSMGVPGNINSIIAGRISYLLDLRGPSLCVDTACSSSLVAVHLACQSIRNQECEIAIAGSVKINLLPLANEVQIGIESSTWRARSFDDSSDGTGAGEGVISFVLKPLHKARLDGDAIHAVIKGSAINQDGSSVGMTAPNVLAQEEVIVRAWNNAGIDPETITYFEAHGTGTKLGDPIEIAGIERAFRRFTARKQFVALGSAKANIGHLDHAAGAMGLLKCILALKHQQLPPLMHFSKPNRTIDFINSPVYVNNRLTNWAGGSSPRRCGVSAFGMSGTNCHLVVEEAPVQPNDSDEAVKGNIEAQQHIFTLSAKNEQSLRQLVELYVSMDWDHVRLDDVCFVANTGRDHHSHRLAIIVESCDELVKKLGIVLSHGWQTDDAQGVYSGVHKLTGLEAHREDIDDLDMRDIARLYVQGAQVEWSRLYSNGSYRRVHLPTYPFARTRCWLDIEHMGPILTAQAGEDKSKFVSSQEVELIGRHNGEYSANERLVAQMWGTTLGFTQLNVEDNFFELGGDSILALKIVNSLSAQLSTHLQVSDLFNYATIEQLSKYIDTQAGVHHVDPLWEALVPIEGREHYPLTSSQLRVFVQEQLGAGGTDNNTPFCIMVEGYIDQNRFSEAFQHLVNRHESLRTSFHYRDGEAIQLVTPVVDFQVEYSKSSLDHLDSAIRQFIRPFDLANPPLIRVGLVTVHRMKHLIIIDLHHMISDGVSSSILIKEFCQLYKGQTLPDIRIQYKDYAVWHTRMLSSGAFQLRKQYWLDQLSGELPLLQLPTDYPRAEQKSYQGNTLRVPMNAQLKQQLEQLAMSRGVTMNTLLFSLYTLMLHEYANQEQLVVGTLVAGRNHPALEHVIGMFINFLPVRIRVDRTLTFTDFMSKVSTTIVDAYKHDYPFDQMIQDLQVKTDRSRNPLYDTMFIYHNEYNMNPTDQLQMDEAGLAFMEYPLPNTASPLDMKMDVWNDITGQLVLVLQYDTSLFTQHSMTKWIDEFIKLADYVVANPETTVSQIDVITKFEKHEPINKLNLLPHADDVVNNNKAPLKLAISSTFTAEPLSNYLSWWCEQFNVPVEIEYAAYHQVFQELLNPQSLLASNDGINVLLIRFEDWIRDELSDDEIIIQKLGEIYADLVRAFGERQKLIPYMVCTFPILSEGTLSHEVNVYIEGLNERWRSFLRSQEHVFLIECNYSMAAWYQVAQVFDPVKDREGHMPFTDEYYGVVGTEIARKLVAWSRQDFKVIVLDCDHTLWSGVCGEDGPLNVEISEPYKALQQFMLDRYNEGMLLAICSKNNEADVWEVFASHPDMILTKEHFVASSINWNVKASNIQQLAQQLNVGLDSFIFVDDSPMECSEMMLHCPSVLTLRLPEQPQQIPAFLQHAWSFDKLSVTEEDRKRTALYVAESKRQYHLDNEHTNMEDFLRSLNLRIRMTELTVEQLPRAAQLTQRTNQFNMSTIRRSEPELNELLAKPQMQCWGIEVDDRFGDYGFVGVVIARIDERALVIDTFLLSCRVLGRQVEHTILSVLSKYAKSMKLSVIEAQFVSSAKNAPFMKFLAEAGWEFTNERDGVQLFSLHVDHIPVHSEYISVIVNNDHREPPLPNQVEPVHNTSRLNIVSAQGEAASSSELIVTNWDWEVLGLHMDGLRHRHHLLPLHHHNADRLLQITKHNDSKANRRVDYDEALNDTERELISIWEHLLDIQPIGEDDHFFDIGGSSLQAVSLASRIHQHFKVQFTLRDLLVAPTIRLLAKLINRTHQSVYASIEPIADQAYYPVTSAQKRLLVLNELDAESSAYNQPFMFVAEGPLDMEKLESACIELIHRHEALRTVFSWEQGQFVQRVQAHVEFSIEYDEHSTTAIDDTIKAFIRPFNVTHAPLFRAGVIQLEEQRYLLLFDMHHAISDGVSISIMVRELLALYEGHSLSDLRIQYRDYAVWHNNLLQSDLMHEQEQYWLDVFADGEPVLNFPTDKPRPAVRSSEGNRISMELDKNVSDAVEQLASRTGTTPYMVYLAAYNILLSKYSGQEDIVVGSPVAGRRHADLDPLIGMFVQTLALRNKPRGDYTFRQFIASVKEHTLQAFEHQDYPFEQLINKLNVQRDLSRNPLFDTMFVYQNMTWAKASVSNMNVQMYPYNSGRSRFDLTLELAEYESGIRLNLEYATRLFHKRTMDALARHYLNIIKEVTRSPDVVISDIDMLDESERAKLLFGFNATQLDYDSSQTIQQRFEEQAELRASDIAVVYGAERLTYMQLNQRANRLADELRALGVKPNQIVGIQLERSLEMVVSVLGVLKSGAAYLPIDPQYPHERIQYMLEDSLTEVLITHSSLSNELPSHMECLFVDDERFTYEQQHNPRAVNTPNDLAYIIYTSGSTGKPKGVMVEHKGMINLQVYFQEKLGVKHTDKIVQFASFSFDASVWEMFMGLFNGAELHLLSQAVTSNYDAFAQYMNDHEITIATLPPTYLAGLHPDRLDTLCKVITAGSASTLELLEKWGTKVQYMNAYGPTESTICASVWQAPKAGRLDSMSSVPIGTPIPNTQLYVVNRYDQLQPIGVPGELCIGGAGVARGYLHRPQLTAQQFIANPFIPGMRMYKSGDLVRWLPDGNIEYLGRIDDQVKIRGYRIELGEVESCLLKHPRVEQCIVVARAGSGEHEQLSLCAYFETGDQQLDVNELRSFISEQLPDYMVPTYLIKMAQLPLTANGKVDKKCLPHPEPSSSENYVAPNNEIENRLTDIWTEILGVQTIGIKDHFFELGGHSLKAIAMLTRIHQELQVALTLKQVFRSPTIEQLAIEIKQASRIAYTSIPPAQPSESYPLSSGQKKLYVVQQLEGVGTAYNISGAYWIDGNINVLRLEQACNALIQRHESLRTSFDLEDGEFVQYIHEHVQLTIQHIETNDEHLDEVVRGAIAQFDLSKPPLMRVVLVKCNDRHVLIIDMHHIISDGISTSIMIHDLLKLYAGDELPELTVQYKDYAVWQQSSEANALTEQQAQYWMNALSGRLPVLDIPTDFPRPSIQSYSGARVQMTIDEQLTGQLKALALASNSTLYMVMLSSYMILLSKYSGQEDILVGTPSAGRTHAELQNVMGMFVNTLVIRNQPAGHLTFAQLLEAVKSNTIQAFDHQDYPFDLLVEKLELTRDVSRNPLFDAMFIMQNFDTVEIQAEQLAVKPYVWLPSIAKFDLSLELSEELLELHLSLDYASKLFREETAKRLLSDYVKILSAITSNPSVKLQDIQLLDKLVKRSQLLSKEIEFNF